MLKKEKKEFLETEGAHKDGELYKTVFTFGRSFELRYGFYEERDMESRLCEPVVIYPDFLKAPLNTEEGEPFVTMMQDACSGFLGDGKPTPDTTCAECKHFLRGEEWFGICRRAEKGKKE